MAQQENGESLAVRQQNELEVLQAIYSGWVEDLRPSNKQDGHPLHVKIHLFPQESMSGAEVHVRVDLTVKCPLLYPNQIPEVALDNARGISNAQLYLLTEELCKITRKCVGEVMIHELCQHVQAFLYENNKPPAESFHHQMLSKKLELERRNDEAKKKQMEREAQLAAEMMDEEIKRQKEGLREEAKRRRQNQAEGERQSSLTEFGTPPDAQLLERSHRSSIDERSLATVASSQSASPRKITSKRSSSATVVRGRQGEGTTCKSTTPPVESRLASSATSVLLGDSDASADEDDNDYDDDDEIPFMPSSNSSSRLQQEFKQFKQLGRGAYGDVIRARNRLDGRLYAIKRIPFNPNRKRLMKKMTREVKLLSRLNHENVVRYFTSWVETAEHCDESDTSSTATLEEKSDLSILPAKNKSAKSPDQNVSASGDDWDLSDFSGNIAVDDEFDDDDDDDEEDEDMDFFGKSFRINSDDSDDGIVFAIADGGKDAELQSKVSPRQGARSHTPLSSKHSHQLHFLYIQMEYCEKKTLRDCIDEGVLYKDDNRVWQLLREILEGLQHIHDQGMIHRDLKPMNIFLDSQNHVKIGDFGLATTGMVDTPVSGMMDVSCDSVATVGDGDASMDRQDGALTGTVGTALYVAPEVMDNGSRYNQKVDLYSLGIMFFEMSYRPLSTGMERIKLLTALRESIQFPDDFNHRTKKNQMTILKWLLTHDPIKRPTCKELLKCDLLPPPHMEESECNDMLRKTVSAPNSRAFKYLVNTIFSQSVPERTEFGYDREAYKPTFRRNHALVQRLVNQSLERIFQRHGAVSLPLPLLIPKNSLYKGLDTYVCLMDHSGCLVSLPYDSRVPLARYISHTGATDLKRYSFDRVFRENRVSGVHPRELVSCSYDIVSSLPELNGVLEAEVLRVVHEVISEFPSLSSSKVYRLRMNHLSLVRAVLYHCDIAESLHSDVLHILSESKLERQRKETQTRLCNLGVASQTVDLVYQYFEREETLQQLTAFLQPITKVPGQVSSLAKKGLHEMETVISYIETLGCQFEHLISLGLVANINQYSGMLFQVVSDVKLRNKASMDVLAVGGRYDCLLNRFQSQKSTPTLKESRPAVVGVTIAYDKIVTAVESHASTVLPSIADVLICSVGHRSQIKERLAIASALWDVGVSVEVSVGSLELEEEKDYCRVNRIGYLIVQKDSGNSIVKVQASDRDRVIKKDISATELVEFFQQKILGKSDNSDQGVPTTAKSQTSLQSSGDSGNVTIPISTNSTMALPGYNISYTLQESNKPAKNTKRVYENQISTGITTTLSQISSRCRVEVVAVELNAAVVRALAANLDTNQGMATFTASFNNSNVVKEFQRYKRYMERIIESIQQLKFESKLVTSPAYIVIILYSLLDDMHKVLM